MKSLFDYLRNAVPDPCGDEPTDAHLLQRFRDRREEVAFAALVKRHGPMVLSVARRLLGRVQDAEDVFQATFLVLVRRAGSVARPELLGNWLYGVAYRTALHARSVNARRRARETQVDVMPEPAVAVQESSPDLPGLLDHELNRLPEKYRTAVVLCELEGRPRKEVARQLGIPEGTVSSRLALARRKLARRLARRGLTLSAATAGASVIPRADAGLPAALASATVQAAVRLAGGSAPAASANVLNLVEGVLKAMFWRKAKIAAAVLLSVSLSGLVLAAVLQTAWGSSTSPAVGAPQRGKGSVPRPQAAAAGGQADPKPDDKAPGEPQRKDVIRPGDRLQIQVRYTLPDAPINGVFMVEASGKVALGPEYGRVEIQGLTLEQAEQALVGHLSKIIKSPRVTVTRFDAAGQSGLAGRVEQLERRLDQLEKQLHEQEAALRKMQKK